MKCPYCGAAENKVVDKRESEDMGVTRRRRECIKCGKRFTTYERVEEVELIVVKNDGSRQPFDRRKLILGIRRACEKRPVSSGKIESIVDNIGSEMRRNEKKEIPSKAIGEMVMETLKDLDQVAYVRFASVYKKFGDVRQFIMEIEQKILRK